MESICAMKISDFIKELEKEIEKSGDCRITEIHFRLIKPIETQIIEFPKELIKSGELNRESK